MLTAELKDRIIWIRITKEFDNLYEQFLTAINPIFESGEEYIGFISDGREMPTTIISIFDQRKLALHHKTHNPDKPNALLMTKWNAVAAKFYCTLTNARNTEIFINEEDAIHWVKEFKGLS